MKKGYFISVVLCIAMMILGVVFAGAPITLFLSIPALIVVVFLPSFIASGVYGLRTFLRSFRVAFNGTGGSVEELSTASSLFRLLFGSVLLTGFITSMIGLLAMLSALMDKSELGRTLALALITLFYSLILIFLVVLPFKYACDNRLREMTAAEN